MTAAHKAAFVCEALEEVAARSYESDDRFNRLPKLMFSRNYC